MTMPAPKHCSGSASMRRWRSATARIKATAIGSQHVRHCRFGHTVPGSFSFRIESPLPPPTHKGQLSLDSSLALPPFPRRVMERIARGVVTVRNAVLAGDPEPLAQGYGIGLNANLCDALRQMLEATGDTGLDWVVHWSPTWRPSNGLTLTAPVRLEYRAAQFLEGAARGLRQTEHGKARLIRGRI